MTHTEDIIRMAHEAGIIHPEIVNKTLERFAALVASAEREACEKVATEHAAKYKPGGSLHPMMNTDITSAAAAACEHIAHLISARGLPPTQGGNEL